MENLTFTPLTQPIVFELEGFDVPPGHGPLFFFLALFAYMVVLLGNGVVICVIMTDRSLHRPMFVMICHLVVCDLLGATAVLPSLMMHFLMGQKKISYLAAIIQGFCVHTYGVAMHTILGAMAVDRYVAVCEPLRYHSIMTSARLHSCCAVAWIVALLLVAVLFSFHVNLPYCRRTIQHVYCSNKSMMNLACAPPLISNIYGLFITWFVSTGMFVVIAYFYIRILRAAVKQGRSDSSIRTKAFQTCASHFVVYVFYELATLIIVVNYRFPSTSQNINKFLGILFIIVPPAINPIIYGLVSKDLRSSIIKRFSTRTALLVWMENLTFTPLTQPIVFELEGFDVPPGHGPLFFFLALFAYMVVLLGNGVVICVIMTDRSLHRPMFVMICHLVVCDLLGATAVLPRLMMHFLMGQKKISYLPAIAQGFCVHTYGVAMQTILGVMAVDRYVAVCEPLRYHSIMTSARLHSCCAVAWIVALLLIAVLFSFHMNVPLCGQLVQHVYCSNRGILNLACIPTAANNIYGLAMTWSVSTGVFVIIAFSYIRILSASFKRQRSNSSVHRKALQTCVPHLVVYVLYQIASVIIIVSLRFPSVSQNIRKFFSILFIIVPPALNPIIYGLVSKDLRSGVTKLFSLQVMRVCHKE
ncbi:uncharacterized protein LOC102224804 [Xiphophorus maculatus]|uniref:uncharacterized protein LOC102224804 n=1 Tax=Xiphophorus maculatus TaxID=8083 RepID=UPI000C6E386B|nr:uncharacterized protein LOC102224804 [Xiphophorus maculatus]